MRIREPVVAGRFYPGEADACRAELQRMMGDVAPAANIGETIVAGLVPHAGWAYSGRVTAKVFEQFRTGREPDSIVLFGGTHRYRGKQPAIFMSGRWETPVGAIEIDERLADRILGHTNLIADDAYAHEDEHSIEVQLPFVKYLFPNAGIVPIMVPATATAHEAGEAVSRTIKAYGLNAIVVGTTDLTHYGPGYGFAPKGAGVEALRWAKEVNDRAFLDRVCSLEPKELVAEAGRRKNACSSGAAAATVAAAIGLGATVATLLEHTTSYEVRPRQGSGTVQDAVGYAGVVFS